MLKEQIWSKLLQFKDCFSKDSIGWGFNNDGFHDLIDDSSFFEKEFTALLLKHANSNKKQLSTYGYTCHSTPYIQLQLFVKPDCSEDLLFFLKQYWPLCIITKTKTNRPYVFVHTAISLDGYMATLSGHSKWIGNKENLEHAHRLRAIFDAILVGGNTVERDQPALTVRHVEGNNPKRLVLSNKNEKVLPYKLQKNRDFSIKK